MFIRQDAFGAALLSLFQQSKANTQQHSNCDLGGGGGAADSMHACVHVPDNEDFSKRVPWALPTKVRSRQFFVGDVLY